MDMQTHAATLATAAGSTAAHWARQYPGWFNFIPRIVTSNRATVIVFVPCDLDL